MLLKIMHKLIMSKFRILYNSELLVKNTEFSIKNYDKNTKYLKCILKMVSDI